MPSQEVFSWLRTRFFPISGVRMRARIIMHALLRALVALKKDKSQTVIASGIGCRAGWRVTSMPALCIPPTAGHRLRYGH